MIMPAELRSSPPDYKERHANSAPKIKLATMGSMVMWLVIMTPAVSTIQSKSQNIPAPGKRD
jgi:hypothetical protein